MEVQCNKKFYICTTFLFLYFKIILSQEAGTSGNNIEKEPLKPRPKLKIYIYILNTYREHLLCLQPNASGSFLQTCINFAERLKFSHFEGSTIP